MIHIFLLNSNRFITIIIAFFRFQTIRNCSLDALKELRESLMCEINQIPKAQTNIDFEWLAGTNISIPQHVSKKVV